MFNPNVGPVERAIAALDDQQRKIAEVVATAQSNNQLERLIKFYGEVTAFGSTYTTIIVTIGYASLFTVWGNVRDKINPEASLVVALLGLVAVAMFVGWEIIHMRYRSSQTQKMIDIIRGDPLTLEKRLKQHEAEGNYKGLFAAKFEYSIFILTTLIAFASGFVLMGAIAVRVYWGKF
jgi:hypothetical protein